MPRSEGGAEDENGRGVDRTGGRDGVEAVFEREGEAAAVAEGFFLREGAAEPTAAGGVGVGHVEDEDAGCRPF